jgi:hypothetical protein
MDSTTRLQVEGVPPDLKWRLKAYAAMEGLTMRQVILDVIGTWCDERDAEWEALTRIDVSERRERYEREGTGDARRQGDS